MTNQEKLIVDEIIVVIDNLIDFIQDNVSFSNKDNNRDRLEYLQNFLRKARSNL